MTNEERWTLYDSGEFHRSIGIELLDWAGYWTSAGLDGISDPLLKAQTKQAIQIILTDLSYANKVVASLAISDATIKNAQVDAITELMIRGVVTSIMSYRLEWITGIDHVEEVEEPEE